MDHGHRTTRWRDCRPRRPDLLLTVQNGSRHRPPHLGAVAWASRLEGSAGSVEIAQKADLGAVMDDFAVDVHDKPRHRVVGVASTSGTDGLHQALVAQSADARLPTLQFI